MWASLGAKPYGNARLLTYPEIEEELDSPASSKNDRVMSLGTILIIILILALVGVLPTWGYSTSWGYAPGSLVGLLLVIVIILALLGRL